MINQLYVFTFGTNVIAGEWNANFNAIKDSNEQCFEAILDAQDSLAFPDGDLSGVYDAIRARPNSFEIPTDTVVVQPECEHYKTLLNGQDLNIRIPSGFNSQARVLIQIQDDRDLMPIQILYDNQYIVSTGGQQTYKSGYYYVFIYETNNTAYVKLISTKGV